MEAAESMEREDLQRMSKSDLLNICRRDRRRYRGYSGLRKGALVDHIRSRHEAAHDRADAGERYAGRFDASRVLELEGLVLALGMRCSELEDELIRETQRLPFLPPHLVRELSQGAPAECPICFGVIKPSSRAVTGCGHSFCKGCIKEAAQFSSSCPVCRHPIGRPS